ncbi:histidine phosphatase family protein [Agarivorans sp. TSD2052]|uniref:histidine phosphatase family protein n=1 Tax=Agarivorans sp. TSD2052 TaxID=2937286 RepID=UPI00200CBE25|nr:histidine phosphatase family protein [Agarivorans sp. TSD2052]UPW17352.1 histidine phosphatase family protein [Agarivorans sp. TSD2052]
MAKVLLVRHSPPLIEANHCYGQLDVVAEPVQLQACIERLSIKLTPYKPFTVLSSPLKRCSQLAEGLVDQVTFNGALKELDFGAWEGRSWNDVPQQALQAWADNLLDYRLGEFGETVNEFNQRVSRFWQLCQNLPLDSCLVCVTHAGVIRTIIGLVENLDIEQVMSLPINMGSVTCLKIQSSGVKIEYQNC